MSKGSEVVSSLPDSPLGRSAVEIINDTEGIRGAISPTWQSPGRETDEFTEDLIIITGDRVKYLSRERGEGWVVKRDEGYADDEEFEHVMDDVHDYACDYSEERIEKQVYEDNGE
jgi:hypothetical protein